MTDPAEAKDRVQAAVAEGRAADSRADNPYDIHSSDPVEWACARMWLRALLAARDARVRAADAETEGPMGNTGVQ